MNHTFICPGILKIMYTTQYQRRKMGGGTAAKDIILF